MGTMRDPCTCAIHRDEYRDLYHRTTRERAAEIGKGGFKDAVGTYFTDQEFSGVWVSNVPLDRNDGAWGEVLFQITLDLAEPEIAGYEWVEEGKPTENG
jgi:hypothetical protein